MPAEKPAQLCPVGPADLMDDRRSLGRGQNSDAFRRHFHRLGLERRIGVLNRSERIGEFIGLEVGGVEYAERFRARANSVLAKLAQILAVRIDYRLNLCPFGWDHPHERLRAECN